MPRKLFKGENYSRKYGRSTSEGGMDTKRIIEESTLPVACLTILSQTIGMSLIELGNSVPKKKLAFWKVSRHLAKSALDPVTMIQI